MPMFASREVNMAPRLNTIDYVVRTEQSPLALTESARRAIREVDADLALTQRTGEIGVRLALGACPASVAGAIVRQGGIVALAGAVVGLVTALALSQMIESLLFRVSARDPAVFAATTLLLLCVALLACWLPARRGARLSPLEALRTE
jgi:predicted lysophospholipase L1 biosynthesis ABC-type transport system permease subunit